MVFELSIARHLLLEALDFSVQFFEPSPGDCSRPNRITTYARDAPIVKRSARPPRVYGRPQRTWLLHSGLNRHFWHWVLAIFLGSVRSCAIFIHGSNSFGFWNRLTRILIDLLCYYSNIIWYILGIIVLFAFCQLLVLDAHLALKMAHIILYCFLTTSQLADWLVCFYFATFDVHVYYLRSANGSRPLTLNPRLVPFQSRLWFDFTFWRSLGLKRVPWSRSRHRRWLLKNRFGSKRRRSVLRWSRSRLFRPRTVLGWPTGHHARRCIRSWNMLNLLLWLIPWDRSSSESQILIVLFWIHCSMCCVTR